MPDQNSEPHSADLAYFKATLIHNEFMNPSFYSYTPFRWRQLADHCAQAIQNVVYQYKRVDYLRDVDKLWKTATFVPIVDDYANLIKHGPPRQGTARTDFRLSKREFTWTHDGKPFSFPYFENSKGEVHTAKKVFSEALTELQDYEHDAWEEHRKRGQG